MSILATLEGRALRKAGGVPVMLVVLAALVALLSGTSPSMQSIGMNALVSMVMVIGLFTFWGNSGVLSFGHVAFVAIGAYVSALLTIPLVQRAFVLPDLPGPLAKAGAPFVVATVVAALVAALFAAIMSVPLMRLSGTAAGIASFALLIIVQNVASNWTSVTGGLGTLTGVPTDLTLWSAYGWTAAAIVIAAAYSSSRFGKRLRASREDDIAAQALGIKISRERRLAFILSAGITGAAGSLYAHRLGAFGPTDFYVDLTFLILVMLIIGGLRSLIGAVIGTIVVTVIDEVLARWEGGEAVGFLKLPIPGGASDLLLALLLVFILIRWPDGLTGTWQHRRRGGVVGASEPTPVVAQPS